MSHIHIVVDTSAQITKEMLKEHPNLHSISLKVRIGSQEWPEDEITNSQLFKMAKERKEHPQTSQPAPGDFIDICKPLLDAGKEIIVITVSGGLSGTVNSAKTVAKMLGEDRMHVIDSGTASVGMVQLAKEALAMADLGIETSEIIKKLTIMAAATHTLILVDTLDYLYKGGRIGGAAALFGTILQIRPVIHLVAGKIAVLDKVRTKQRAVTRILEEIKQYENLAYIGIGNVEAPLEAEGIIERVKEMNPGVPILHAGIGSVLAAHLGPGMIGIVLQEKIK